MSVSGKIAFLFPGQGSQSVGMAKALVEASRESARVFDTADRVLGFSLSSLCFDGPEAALRDTANAQPAILTASIAVLAAFRQSGGPLPAMAAGHSLGEYGALVAAGVLDFETALRLVRRRGEAMAAAGEKEPGGMAAILGLAPETIESLCEIDPGRVVVANLNSPDQTIISGETPAIERVSAAAREAGAKRAIPLPVSGAFHSPLVENAATVMENLLAGTVFSEPTIPVYANVTARPVADGEEVRRLLPRQIVSRVRWTETIRAMTAGGAGVFIEIGPGRVLSGLARKIDPAVTVMNVEDPASLSKTITALNA